MIEAFSDVKGLVYTLKRVLSEVLSSGMLPWGAGTGVRVLDNSSRAVILHVITATLPTTTCRY
jgi:hypothetical protein